jgi:heme A synthase
MLGINGTGVAAAYILTILSAALCVWYGIVNWNKPEESEEKAEIAEEAAWERKDPELGEQP